MSDIKAHWTICLDTNCPECHHPIDLTITDEFWADIGAGEADTPESTDYEVICDSCDHEFTVDFVL